MRRVNSMLLVGAWAALGTLFGALVVVGAQQSAAPLWLFVLPALGAAGLAAAGSVALLERWGLSEDERAARARWKRNMQRKWARLRSQWKELRREHQHLQKELARTQQALQRAQREASQAQARATQAEQQMQHWQEQAQSYQQQVQDLQARLHRLERDLHRAEQARRLWEAVHRLEQSDEIFPEPLPTENTDELAQRLREAIARLRLDRDTALELAREAEDRLQRGQAVLAQAQAEIEACRTQKQALEEQLQTRQQWLRQVLEDLLDPDRDIIAVPADWLAALATQHDRQRAWASLLRKLQQPALRQGQTKALPGGEGFVYPRGTQPRRVLFFEQRVHKRILWVCRLWDAHEDDRIYDAVATQGRGRTLCPEPDAFVYWAPVTLA